MENANKKFRYSIRKFKVGVGSVLIATCLLGAGVSTPTAFATTETSTATQVEAAQPTSETEPTVQITGTVSTENTNSESKVAPEVKEEAPVAEKAETATKSAEQKVASEPEKTEEPTPAPAALTSEAKEEVSAKTQENVEVKNSPLQDVQNLLKDVERELEELEVFTEYDASVYWYQKSLWEQFSEIGKREMDRVLTLKEDSAEIKKVHESLFEFGNQIKMERFTRQVAPYLEKYSDDEFIKNEYRTNLEQSDNGSYASQGGNTFKAYVDKVEQSVERIVKRGEELERKNLKTEVPKEAPKAAEKTKLDFKVQKRTTYQFLDFETKEQEDPNLPLGEKEERQKGERGEESETYQDVIVGDKIVASTLISKKRKDPVDHLIAKGTLVEKHPDTAPTAPEKPKLDFTVKERVEREILDYMVEEQDDASLPLGQTKVLREGQKGEVVKKYQDVIVEGNVIASNLLSENRKAPVNRLIAKGTLVEKTPDAPAPKTEEEVPAPTPMPETPMDKPKTGKVESDKQMPEAKQPEMKQPKAEDMPKEEMPKAEQPKAENSAPKTAVPEVAPKTAEKPKLDFTTKERKVEEALPIKEEIRYDASLALGKSYLLQEGKAGKKVSVYQDVIVDGKVVATNLLSETVVEGQNRILVKGSLEMKKEEVKTTPSVQSNPTLSHKGAPSANKATLPATGEQRNNLALVGLGLAGISLAVVATAINKKSKDQI
ncbi:G5 domain-containing protein [Streptococcus suis]|uniref:G5 domain-containing protein n=1 Tax=Streptococcus suis TaxID=1307 RepID=UPI0009454E54|nr:G5 domain-containing protein [Streptococcus suis]WNF73931.1 G5 domain-containing protein [Streptococcus suis]HEL1667956.1 G5 domain-containing protein [Streptococcus suis]HEM2533994.1 G5 domain-containing protein [Streptococcus suis]HEM2552579.1 G5 domain-containing protein [Streptococcus suis]HEM2558508.1 G5 domain-containing protein [Streptococcus suis]